MPTSTLFPHAFFTRPGHLTFTANTQVVTASMLTSIPKDQINTVSIPEGVTSIEQKVFENCTGLTHITFPDSLTTIEQQAFQGCTELTSFSFPDGLTTIEGCAFFGCTGLTHLTLPDSLTTISDGAFENCTNLKTLFIPDSLAEYCQATGIDLNTNAMITSNKLDAFRRKNHLEKNTSMSEIFILYQAQQKLIPLPNTLTNLKQHTVTQLSLKSLTSLPIEFHIIIPAIRLFSQIPTTTYLLQMALNPLGDKAMQATYPLAEWITWIDAAKIWLAKSTGHRLPHHIQPHNATRRNKQRKTVYWEPEDTNLTLYQDYATSTQAVSWEKSAPQKPDNRHHKHSIFSHVRNSFFPLSSSKMLSRHATQRPLFNPHRPPRHAT